MQNFSTDVTVRLKENNKLAVASVLILSDFICMSLSAITAFQFRFPDKVLEGDSRPALAQFDYRRILLIIILCWLFIFIVSGIYRFKHANLFVLNLQLVVKKSIYFFFFLGFVSFILKASFSRIVFAVMLISGLVFLVLGRLVTHYILLMPLVLKKRLISKLMIVGKSRQDLNVYSKWIIENRSLGYAVVSRMECLAISSSWLQEFDRILHFTPIDEILLLPGMESDTNFSRFVNYCEDLEIKTNWIPLDSGNLGYWLIPQPQVGIPFLAFSQSSLSFAQRTLKRSFDMVFALLALVVLSPVYLVISLLIFFTSGRPVFYSQKRVGIDGKVFNFYKFRSMVKNADSLITSADNIHAKDHVIFKDKKDPRITPIGRILRKYSLDELPQFFNVLINDMSVVGPRPALVREVKKYDSLYERRLNAKPGVTGPWQISGRSDLDLQTSVALDLNYLVNWSFTRDLWIIIATIGAVLKGRGAY
jgi:exopolysaccharide biosynthesis polyprenyl glycosylphosphotransferase